MADISLQHGLSAGKEVAVYGGDISKFVTTSVHKDVLDRLQSQ